MAAELLQFTRFLSQLSALLLLMFLLCSKGYFSQADCDLNNIQYGVMRTGREISGNTEWEVTISHTCNCSMGNIVFDNCDNFQTVEPVDPALFLKTGDTCLVNQGRFLKPSDSISFLYAWNSPIIFVPGHATVRC